MAKRNTIVVACIVNIWLYMSALRTFPSGAANCKRINNASTPPTMKKNIAKTPYMMPIFLWSTVNNHDFHPVDCTGRRKLPNVVEGTTTLGVFAASSSVDGLSMIAMSVFSDHFSVKR